MLLRIDSTSAEPLYLQIADQLRRSIATGELAAGSRLPPAKELATEVEVNLHTVLRAYGELRDAGFIELRPRRGAVVCPSAPLRSRVLDEVRQLVEVAHRHGLSEPELLELVRDEW